MADYAVTLEYNKGSDGTPDWTGTALSTDGTSGANELRWCKAGDGGGKYRLRKSGPSSDDLQAPGLSMSYGRSVPTPQV